MPNYYQQRSRNYKLIEKQLKDKSSLSLGLPSTLIIEPGAVCSLQCPFCPQSSDSFDFSREFLTLGNFKTIIDYFEKVVDTVLLFNWGEPLLNHSLPAMIRYAADRQMATVVHSNLNSLEEGLAEELIKSGLSELVASIDGASPESYTAYRRGGSWDLALHNLRLLCAKKNELASEKPSITWKYLVFRHNEHELRKAREIAQGLGVAIEFKLAVTQGELSPSLEDYSSDNLADKFIKNYGLPCEQIWRTVSIHADGTILPCCMVSQMKYSVGNFFHEDFRTIWNNQRYRLLREVVSGRIASDESMYCNDCMFGTHLKGARDKNG